VAKASFNTVKIPSLAMSTGPEKCFFTPQPEDRGPPLVVEKNGGLNNTTTYVEMPGEKLGVVILSNRGSENAGARIGRRIMLTLTPSLVRRTHRW